jgi:hypothetical protein
VKISTSTPAAARRLASSTTWTFIPPASPVPRWCGGEVCTLSIATRRGRRRRSVTRPMRSLPGAWALMAGSASFAVPLSIR